MKRLLSLLLVSCLAAESVTASLLAWPNGGTPFGQARCRDVLPLASLFDSQAVVTALPWVRRYMWGTRNAGILEQTAEMSRFASASDFPSISPMPGTDAHGLTYWGVVERILTFPGMTLRESFELAMQERDPNRNQGTGWASLPAKKKTGRPWELFKEWIVVGLPKDVATAWFFCGLYDWMIQEASRRTMYAADVPRPLPG